MPRSICVPNLKFLCIPTKFQIYERGPKFTNFASELPTHTRWGNFVICEMGHVKIYLCTKFDVSSYSGSKFMKGGPKFTNLAPELPPYPTWRNFVIREMMGHVNIYPCTKYEVSAHMNKIPTSFFFT